MSTVRELLQVKGRNIWSVSPKVIVYEALKILAEKNIGALPVIENGKLVGMFSERDYARKVILKGKSSKETTVGELMTYPVLYITSDKTVLECMTLMTIKRVRHLPVFENNQMTGIVTIGDVVNRIITEQKMTIADLENYITGGRYR